MPYNVEGSITELSGRRRRKFWQFAIFERIWSTFPAIGQWSKPFNVNKESIPNCPPQAKILRICDYFIEFRALFKQWSGNGRSHLLNLMSRKVYELPAAGENFENLWFLIEFGALFQQSYLKRSFEKWKRRAVRNLRRRRRGEKAGGGEFRRRRPCLAGKLSYHGPVDNFVLYL